MMSHIHQRDWGTFRSPNAPFMDEVDIDNCAIERIIRNKFWDPMISSDEDEPIQPIDWSKVFKKKNMEERQFRVFVPGFRKLPLHPKLSALTQAEHLKCMKVLMSQNDVLPKVFLGRVCKGDIAVFESKKEIYEKEQKEFIEWAKNLWVTTNFIRALRPKPYLEMVYEAEYKMKELMMQSFPTTYSLAAQIPLRSTHACEISIPKKDLLQVDISQLPLVSYPPIHESKYSVLTPLASPEPCKQHPCKFKLPHEPSTSLLPLTEIHKELAQYAMENDAGFIASENAIKCLIEVDRNWTITVSVCEVIAADGDRSNVVVLGSEFPFTKDCAPVRSYKAYRHMLLNGFTNQSKTRTRTASGSSVHSMSLRNKPTKESTRSTRGTAPTRISSRLARQNSQASVDSSHTNTGYINSLRTVIDKLEASDSDDEDRLLIDVAGDLKPAESEDTTAKKVETEKTSTKKVETEDTTTKEIEIEDTTTKKVETEDTTTKEVEKEDIITRLTEDPPADPASRKILKAHRRSTNQDMEIGLYDCVCKDSEFESPPLRSYRSWQIKNNTTREHVNIIIHCAHKLRNERSHEVIVEPLVEYQLDVGATAQSSHKLQSLAFSLMLRKNADLANVRIDGTSGEVVTVDVMSCTELTAAAGGAVRPHVADAVHTACNQLAGLLPGHYLLKHEPSHGTNAILYCSGSSASTERVTLAWGESCMPAAEEARLIQAAPRLAAVPLPIHKQRRMLPLAFTYDSRQISRESKPVTRVRPPPAALQLEGENGTIGKWPKKRKRKGKKF